VTDELLGRWAMAGRVLEIRRDGAGLFLAAPGVPVELAPRLDPDPGGGYRVTGQPYEGLRLEIAGDGLRLGGVLRLVRDDAASGPTGVLLPASAPDRATLAAYRSLLEQARRAGGAVLQPPDGLDLGDWLIWLTEREELLFHGSDNGELEVLQPRRESWEMSDEGGRGNLAEVYATDDALWALWFAILDREAVRGSFRSASEDFGPAGTAVRVRFFSLDQRVLPRRPFSAGWLYLLPRDGFRHLPIMPGGPPSHEWGSPAPVVPLARLPVDPGDVPYLGQVGTHDDGELMVFEDLADLVRAAGTGAEPTGTGVVLRLTASPELAAVLPR
jgi:hypothetical protein